MDMEDAERRWVVCGNAVMEATLEIAQLRKAGETPENCPRLRELDQLVEVAQAELEELQRTVG